MYKVKPNTEVIIRTTLKSEFKWEVQNKFQQEFFLTIFEITGAPVFKEHLRTAAFSECNDQDEKYLNSK